MNILQGGAPKCGNFWLYQIIQQILRRTGYNTTSYIEQQPIYSLAKNWTLNFPEQSRIDVLEITELQDRHRISSIYSMPIDDIRAYARQSPHVWTHSPICCRSPEVFACFTKKVYIFRDPRDRALSAAQYYCSPYMLKYFPQEESNPERFLEKNFSRLLHEWVWHVYDHLRLSQDCNIHLLSYEGLLLNFQEELEGLLRYLELELSPRERQDLEQAVRFDTLKKKNPQHLKKGKTGYWRAQLSPEQMEQAVQQCGPLLFYLGYPLSPEEEDAPPCIKSLAPDDLSRLKKALLQAQEFLYQQNLLPYP